MLGTFLQQSTPSAYMGRVMGVVGGGALVAQPLGLLAGGPMIAGFGLTGALIAISATLLALASWLILVPALRQIDAPG
jgi:hypothetical protein